MYCTIKKQGCLFFILSMVVMQTAAQQELPSDVKATTQTVNLYNNLKKLLNIGVMFGHQDDLAYGVGWEYMPGRSNTKDAAADYPAVYGWDLGHLELDALYNLDSVPFAKMKDYIAEGYGRGSVITISWHLNNPVNGKTAWDDSKGAVAEILPGASKNAVYKSWLDKVAAFMQSLKGKNGELIPVIFRPFHELTGEWFWWGKNRCSADEFKKLWRYTVQYLRDEKQVHNLLYAYNTAGFNTRDNYLERYPGDDVVDIVSYDDYQYGDAANDDAFVKQTDNNLSILEAIAAEKNKIPAFAETGYEKIPYAKWFTTRLLKALGRHKLSYVLLWRDGGLVASTGPWQYKPSDSHFIPFPGHPSQPDFLKFSKFIENAV